MQSNQNTKTFQALSKNINLCIPCQEQATNMQDILSKHSIHSQTCPTDQFSVAQGIATKQSHHSAIGQIVPSDIATKHISSQHQSKSFFNVDTMPLHQGSKISVQNFNQANAMSKNSNAITADQVLLQDSNQGQFEAMISKQFGSKQLPSF